MVSCCSFSLISSLAALKASSSALGPIMGGFSSSVDFLNNVGSSFGLGVLRGLIIRLSFLFAFWVKVLKCFNNSTGVALSAVGTKDSPLLSTSVCILDSGVFERLTMFSAAQL